MIDKELDDRLDLLVRAMTGADYQIRKAIHARVEQLVAEERKRVLAITSPLVFRRIAKELARAIARKPKGGMRVGVPMVSIELSASDAHGFVGRVNALSDELSRTPSPETAGGQNV